MLTKTKVNQLNFNSFTLKYLFCSNAFKETDKKAVEALTLIVYLVF